MGRIDIDFLAANSVSNQIEDEVELINNMISISDSGFASINGLPTQFFKETISEYDLMRASLLKLSEQINTFSYAFDHSVENYYNKENDITVSDNSITGKIKGSDGKFVWGYKTAYSSITRVNSSEMERMLIKHGAKPTGNNTYEIVIDDVKYEYDIKNNFLFINGNQIKCDFYLSNKHDMNSNITSTVTLLGGTGERSAGPIDTDGKRTDKAMRDDVSISENALLIVPYTGVWDQALETYGVVGSSHFSEKIFDINSNTVERSIIGLSEGGNVGAKAISENPGLYNRMVFLNSATTPRSGGGTCIKNGNYAAFNDVEIMYIETIDGWSYDPQKNTIIGSMLEFTNNGIDPSNITLISNDTNLNNLVDRYSLGINVDNSLNMAASSGNIRYSGHGPGGWEVLNNSEIINYLSM